MRDLVYERRQPGLAGRRGGHECVQRPPVSLRFPRNDIIVYDYLGSYDQWPWHNHKM